MLQCVVSCCVFKQCVDFDSDLCHAVCNNVFSVTVTCVMFCDSVLCVRVLCVTVC